MKVKKFESFNLDDKKYDLLEYFIDLDKNHGGDFPVDVSCKFIEEGDFFKISIESRGDFDFEEFLKKLKSKVEMVLSIGDFDLSNGNRPVGGDNFGFFFLDIKESLEKFGIPSNPTCNIEWDTLSSIGDVKRGLIPHWTRRYFTKEDLDKIVVNLDSLVMWFKEV
jgi:hypothetical protein